jgi:hypothetical protein
MAWEWAPTGGNILQAIVTGVSALYVGKILRKRQDTKDLAKSLCADALEALSNVRARTDEAFASARALNLKTFTDAGKASTRLEMKRLSNAIFLVQTAADGCGVNLDSTMAGVIPAFDRLESRMLDPLSSSELPDPHRVEGALTDLQRSIIRLQLLIVRGW